MYTAFASIYLRRITIAKLVAKRGYLAVTYYVIKQNQDESLKETFFTSFPAYNFFLFCLYLHFVLLTFPFNVLIISDDALCCCNIITFFSGFVCDFEVQIQVFKDYSTTQMKIVKKL